MQLFTKNTVHSKYSSYCKSVGVDIWSHCKKCQQQLTSHCAIYAEAQQAAASLHFSSQYFNSICKNPEFFFFCLFSFFFLIKNNQKLVKFTKKCIHLVIYVL